MTNRYTVGQTVRYHNGCEYTGQIVQTPTPSVPYYIVIDDEAGMILWNAGFAVGSNIVAEQIIEVIK